jgi:hypothetical protein
LPSSDWSEPAPLKGGESGRNEISGDDDTVLSDSFLDSCFDFAVALLFTDSFDSCLDANGVGGDFADDFLLSLGCAPGETLGDCLGET